MRRVVAVLSCAWGIIGCVGDTPVDKVDSGTLPDATPDTSKTDAAADVSAPKFTIGGNVHFLHAAGGDAGVGLVLTNNGTDPVTVTNAGAFTFPTQAATYDVTVTTNPPGQVCSVRGNTGKGTATADVTTIEVGCTIALQSSGGTSVVTTQSKTPVAIPGVAPLAFTTDVASKALVSLMVPSVALPQSSYDDVFTAIRLDGNVVASGRSGNQGGTVGPAAHTIYAIIDVPAGSHSLTSTWNTVFNVGNNTITANGPFPIQLDVVVLDSLSTYVASARGVGSASQSTSSSSMAPMMADVAFTTQSAGPVLGLFQAPYVTTGNGVGSTLYGSAFNLSVDSTLVSTGRVNANLQNFAPLLVALSPTTAGTHALKAAWANPTPSVAVQAVASPTMDAIVFSGTAKTASSQVTGDQTTSSGSFISIPGLAPLTVSPTQPTKALVIMHVDSAGGAAVVSAGGEFTVALDNAGIAGGMNAIGAAVAGATYPLTLLQLVSVPAGSHTLQGQFRSTTNNVHTGPGTTSLSAIVIE